MSPQSDRDAGFCSGSSELGDDRSDSPHSQIDTSEDSIDVKLPILLTKNKRKSSEPIKVVETDLGPLKKRKRYDHFTVKSEATSSISGGESLKEAKPAPAPFRPWTVEGPAERTKPVTVPSLPVITSPADLYARHPGVTTLHRAFPSPIQEEPLALVKKKPVTTTSESETVAQGPITKQPTIKVKSTNSLRPPSAAAASAGASKSSQRNYKNMTRERRIEANARERSRVHTISAAYENLRKCIPSYSSSQKLSKLAVLRIACAYILALSRMNGEDLSADSSQPDIQECIEAVSRILQAEGKVKKEGEEDDDDD